MSNGVPTPGQVPMAVATCSKRAVGPTRSVQPLEEIMCKSSSSSKSPQDSKHVPKPSDSNPTTSTGTAVNPSNTQVTAGITAGKRRSRRETERTPIVTAVHPNRMVRNHHMSDEEEDPDLAMLETSSSQGSESESSSTQRTNLYSKPYLNTPPASSTFVELPNDQEIPQTSGEDAKCYVSGDRQVWRNACALDYCMCGTVWRGIPDRGKSCQCGAWPIINISHGCVPDDI